jgi:hypothetical protein
LGWTAKALLDKRLDLLPLIVGDCRSNHSHSVASYLKSK